MITECTANPKPKPSKDTVDCTETLMGSPEATPDTIQSRRFAIYARGCTETSGDLHQTIAIECELGRKCTHTRQGMWTTRPAFPAHAATADISPCSRVKPPHRRVSPGMLRCCSLVSPDGNSREAARASADDEAISQAHNVEAGKLTASGSSYAMITPGDIARFVCASVLFGNTYGGNGVGCNRCTRILRPFRYSTWVRVAAGRTKWSTVS